MKRAIALFAATPLLVITIFSGILPAQNDHTSASKTDTRPVIYVMPNAFATPGSADTVQGVADSGRDGREPQVAKTYHELQTRKECQGFVENMNKDKADYFLLLPHGGGKTAGRFLISKATCWPRGSRCAWKVRLNTRAWQLRRIARPTRPHNRHKWQLSAALDRCASI